MDCKKYVEVVKETEKAIVATIWTGANYYIDIFDKSNLDAYIAYAAEANVHLTYDDAIRSTSVNDMMFLCKHEDFSDDLLNDVTEHLILEGERHE